MFVDTSSFINNGKAEGPEAEQLARVRFDPGLMRPYRDTDGRVRVTMNTFKRRNDGSYIHVPVKVEDLPRYGVPMPKITSNASVLRRDEWIQFDNNIQRAYMEELRLWSDLATAVPYGGFNAMSHMTIESYEMSRAAEAVVDMDAVTDGRDDRPLFIARSIPLPITHSDFSITERQLAVSRNTGAPIDTLMGEEAGRRVGEMVEKVTAGTQTGTSYGYRSTGLFAHNSTLQSKVYGMINYPHRITSVTLTAPTGANPDQVVLKVLAMRQVLLDAFVKGPYVIYHSTDWDQYLDNDYVTGTAAQGLAAPGTTLRQRLMRIEGIQDVRRLDFLTPAVSHVFTLVMVAINTRNVRAINGMGITTVQWDTKGGLNHHYKVMAIQVAEWRSDYNGVSGIVHATT